MTTAEEDNRAILQKIENNWETFKTLVKSSAVFKERQASFLSLINSDDVESRIMMCPASPRTEFYGAYPGGLVEAALKTHKIMYDLDKVYGFELSPQAILTTALFHDVGKIGNAKFDYFIEKDSDWHRKLGIMYDINPKLIGSAPALRSLWWLTDSGVRLTEDEFLAISGVKDRFERETTEAATAGSDSMLSIVLQQAIKVVSVRGKGKNSLIQK